MSPLISFFRSLGSICIICGVNIDGMYQCSPAMYACELKRIVDFLNWMQVRKRTNVRSVGSASDGTITWLSITRVSTWEKKCGKSKGLGV